MRNFTLRLSASLKRQMDKLARTTNRTRSEIVRRAIRSELAVARFRALRKASLPFAEAAGYLSDDDIFQALGQMRPTQKL